jgi:hypothetical protein
MIKLLISQRGLKIVKMKKRALRILKINKRTIQTSNKWIKKSIMETKCSLITCREDLFLNNKCLHKDTHKCL